MAPTKINSELLARTGKLEEQLVITEKERRRLDDLLQEVNLKNSNTAKQFRADIKDLQERLQTSLSINQYMRGYIARVQEDDVVREDLMVIGEPGGQEQMVPKRKSTRFDEPSNYGAQETDPFSQSYDRDLKPPRHWIRY